MIRLTDKVEVRDWEVLDPYWADLVRLLRIFKYRKQKKTAELKAVRREMIFPIYDAYIGPLTTVNKPESKL